MYSLERAIKQVVAGTSTVTRRADSTASQTLLLGIGMLPVPEPVPGKYVLAAGWLVLDSELAAVGACSWFALALAPAAPWLSSMP